MGTYGECSLCHEYGFTNTHRCPPRYEIILADLAGEPLEDWTAVYARDGEQAAEKFCERHDLGQGEWSLDERDVIVRDAAGAMTVYEVEAEMVPRYTAHRSLNALLPLPDPDPEAEDE